MTDDPRTLAIEGIRFFGEMSASISHEIKNVFAIVNENAGLLADLVSMSARGMPLSTERLEGLAQSMARQVSRGDRIVKGMNRFAHSADHPEEIVDVGETIQFITDLAARLIAMRGPAPYIESPPAPVRLETNRFFLENLIWNCLRRIMDARVSDQDQPISIRIEAGASGARIIFRAPPGTPHHDNEAFPTPREEAVSRLLGARLTVDDANTEITLIIP